MKKITHTFLLTVFLSFITGCEEAKVKVQVQQAPQATSPSTPSPVTEPAGIELLKPPPYRYERFNRVDPFEPIIKEEKKVSLTLNPLERFDISELKLKAIVYDPQKPYILIEDPEGNTHILTKGDRLGKNNGQITRISRDSVYIIEKYEDIFGNVRTNEVTLTVEE